VYNLTNVYTFNVTDLTVGTHYYKWYANDSAGNYNDTLEQNYTVIILDDENMFYIKNESGANITWFGNEGNIVLKGTCISQLECTAPSNSFIIQNIIGDTMAYIDPEGNMCIENGDCGYQSESCNPIYDAFIIRNSTFSNMSYIDTTGDLCLTGYLIQNGMT